MVIHRLANRNLFICVFCQKCDFTSKHFFSLSCSPSVCVRIDFKVTANLLSNLRGSMREIQSKHRCSNHCTLESNAESHYHQPKKKTTTMNILPIHFWAVTPFSMCTDYKWCKQCQFIRIGLCIFELSHTHTHIDSYNVRTCTHFATLDVVDAKTIASLHKPHGFIFIVVLSEIYVINYKDR